MKWIEDLPDDFTQDFKFSVTGVDDPHAWLGSKLGSLNPEWEKVHSLPAKEILKESVLREALTPSDQDSEVIHCVFHAGAELQGCPEPAEYTLEINQSTRTICFGPTNLESAPNLNEFPDLRVVDFYGCIFLRDLSGLSGLQNLVRVNLESCDDVESLTALEQSSNLVSVGLRKIKCPQKIVGIDKLTSVSALDLTMCRGLENLEFLDGFTNLQKLDIRGCRALADISQLGDKVKLKTLRMSSISKVTDYTPLSNLHHLDILELANCQEVVHDLSFLPQLKQLRFLGLGNNDLTLADLSEISQLHNLVQLNLKGCTGLSAGTLWRQVSGLSRLRSVEGMGEALDQLIPFNSAILREAKEAVKTKRGDVLEHAKSGTGVGLLAKRLALKSLAVCPLDESSLQEFNSVSWSDSEWEILWRAIHDNGESLYADFLAGELDKAKTVASLSDMITDPTGPDMSMAPNLLGWLRTVADGLEWQKAKAHVTEMMEWLPFAEMKTGAVELLMAMRQLGLVNEEQTVLSTVTDKRAREFTEMVEYRLATNHAKAGRWKDAMRHIQRLPQDLADEVRSDVIARWSTEVPDQVAEWMSGFHSEVTREKTALELASRDSSIASSTARHLVLMDLVPNRDALESFIQQMASALPDDPWVVALQDEILSAGAQEAETGSDLMALLESEEVADYVKPKKLQALLDGFRNEEGGRLRLEQMAVALLLEHKGLIDEEEREELLTQWASQPDDA